MCVCNKCKGTNVPCPNPWLQCSPLLPFSPVRHPHPNRVPWSPPLHQLSGIARPPSPEVGMEWRIVMAEAGPVGGQCCVPNWARSPHQFHVADASPHSRRCHHLLHHIQHSTFSTSYCTDPSSGEGKTKQSKHVLNMVFGNIIYYILYTINCILNTMYYILYTIYYIIYVWLWYALDSLQLWESMSERYKDIWHPMSQVPLIVARKHLPQSLIARLLTVLDGALDVRPCVAEWTRQDKLDERWGVVLQSRI